MKFKVYISNLKKFERYDELLFLCEYIAQRATSVKVYFGWNHDPSIEWQSFDIATKNLSEFILSKYDNVEYTLGFSDLTINEGKDPEFIFSNDADLFVVSHTEEITDFFSQYWQDKGYKTRKTTEDLQP
jgi:hypothetical protein